MVTEFKLAVVHFARPNSMQTCACVWINRWTKNGGKSGPGRRAIMGRGPSGRWAVAGRGLRAAGPPSRRAAGPSRACFLVKPSYQYLALISVFLNLDIFCNRHF